VVETGDNAPIDDFPGAFSPELTAESVAKALRSAHEKRDQYSSDAFRAADQIREQWSWENRLREFRNELF